MKKIVDWNLAADQAGILNALQALDDYLEDIIAGRRRVLTDDLISAEAAWLPAWLGGSGPA